MIGMGTTPVSFSISLLHSTGWSRLVAAVIMVASAWAIFEANRAVDVTWNR